MSHPLTKIRCPKVFRVFRVIKLHVRWPKYIRLVVAGMLSWLGCRTLMKFNIVQPCCVCLEHRNHSYLVDGFAMFLFCQYEHNRQTPDAIEHYFLGARL